WRVLGMRTRLAPALAVQAPPVPVCDKPRLVICLGAFPHLAHFFRERLGPGETPCELARRAGIEEQPVAARLHQVGEYREAARDDRDRLGEGHDERVRLG